MTGAATGPDEALSRKTARGLRWSYVESAATALIQIVWLAVISRLLEPRVFGLMAVATLVVNFGVFFARMGVAHAIVQRLEITTDDVRASFTASVVLGTLCFALLWLAAPFLTRVFGKPDVLPLLRALGGAFVLTGLMVTSRALLRRKLHFGVIALATILGALGSTMIGIALALAGAGVWSLVAYGLSGPAIMLVVFFWRAPHSVRPVISFRRFGALYAFGARVSALRWMDFLGSNLDTLIVARYLETATLGQYNRAYFLVFVPLNRYLAASLTTVLFASFSVVQRQHERLRRGYMDALTLAGLVLIPTAAGFAVAAPELVLLVLGPKWDLAVALVPLFAIGAAYSVLTRFAELLCEARAELNKTLRIQAAYLVVLASFLMAATSVGDPRAFAFALLCGELVRHLAYVVLMRGMLRLTVRELWVVYVPPVFAALVVVVLIGGARTLLLPAAVPLAVVVAGEVVAGVVGLVLGIRCNPVAAVRIVIRGRLQAAGILQGARAAQLARLLVGRAS